MLSPHASPGPLLASAELGDVATWIGSLANVATLGLALVASIVGFRIYKIESARDQRAEAERRERAADERRSQANLVSVWFGQALQTEYGSWGRSQVRQRMVWAARVLNASTLPVHDLRVHFTSPGHPSATAEVRLEDLAHAAEFIGVVPPHQEDPLIIELPASLAKNTLPGDLARFSFNVSVQFRDSAGRHWWRDESGYLHETESPKRMLQLGREHGRGAFGRGPASSSAEDGASRAAPRQAAEGPAK